MSTLVSNLNNIALIKKKKIWDINILKKQMNLILTVNLPLTVVF